MKLLILNRRQMGKTITYEIVFFLLLFCSQLWAATYQCVQDTYLDAAYPDDNFGGTDRLLVSNSSAPTRVLMKFAIPDWAVPSNIKQGKLIMYSAPWTGGGGGTTDFEVYSMTRVWTEGTCDRYNDPQPDDGATWNQYTFDADLAKNQWNQPGGDYDDSMHVAGTFPPGNDWGPFPIDITDLLKNRLNTLRDYGVLLKHPLEDTSGGWQNFAGKDSTGYDPPRYPQLEIDYLTPPLNNPPEQPAEPFPANGATAVPLTAALNWSGGDPDKDNTLTYDIYFGAAGKLVLSSSGQTAATLAPGALQLATTYEWKVVARDNYGAETSGPVWNFTTTESGIHSISPASGSPFYLQDSQYIPLPIWVRITGNGTHFQFPKSRVSFGDEGITVLSSIPISADQMRAVIIIGKSAKPGSHDVSVTTGEEVAVGTGLFEVVKFWRGKEQITVQQGSVSVLVDLWGLPVQPFNGKEALRLSEIVEKSAVTGDPEQYFYNLIASDDYSLERGIIISGWGTGLPTWNDMGKGYLYQTKSSGLLTGWEPDTVPGKTGNTYKVSFMDGGTIEIREEDIIN